MKIHTLVIKNIASIEDATIDFNKGILASHPIFLICGETGSGKTTILNAICLALYKKVPYFDTVGDDEKGRQTSAKRKGTGTENWLDNAIQLDQIKNPEQMLRRGAKSGEASLSFVGNDGHLYTATWEAHPNQQDKSKIKSTHRLYDNTAKITYSAVNEIKRMVEQAVGLDFDQFCRTTMLAQGQFSKFICAKDDEKEAILEKLTATERFSSYGAAIHNRYIGIKRQYDLLAAVINETNLLTEAEKAQATQSMAQARKHIDDYLLTNKLVKEKIDWLGRQLQLLSAIEDGKKELEKIQLRRSSDEYADFDSLVRDWDATISLRAEIARKDMLEKQLSAQEERMSEMNVDAEYLLSAVEGLKKQSHILSVKLSSCQNNIGALSKYEPLIDNSAALMRELDNLSSALDLLKKLNDNAITLQTKLEKCDKLFLQHDKAREIAINLVNARKDEANKAAKTVEGINLSNIDSDIKKLDISKNSLLHAKITLQALIDNQEKEKELQDKISKAENDIKQCNDLINDIANKIPTLEADANKLTGEYQGKIDLKNMLTSIRRRFADSHECPLCGSTVEHLHTDDMLDHSIVSSLEQADKARAEVNAAKSAKAQAEGNLRALSKNLDTMIADLKSVSSRRSQAESLFNSKYADCPKSIAEIDNEAIRVENKHNEAVASRKKTTADIKRYNETLKVLGEANESLLKAEKKLQATSESKARIQTEIKANGEALAKAESDIIELQHFIQGFDCCNLYDITSIEGCAKAKSSINDILIDYKKAISEKEFIESEIRTNDSIIAACNDSASRLTVFFPKAKPNGCIIVKDVDKALSDFIQQAATLQGAISSTHRNIDDARCTIDAYFNTPLCLSIERVNQLVDIPEIKYLEARNAIRVICDTENRTKGALGQLNKDLTFHLSNKPEINENDTIATLTDAYNAIDTNINRERELIAEIKQKLISDEEKRARMQAQIAEKERLEAMREKWLTLDRLYGGEKGVNFRRIAQIHVLANLLHRANYFMRDLDDRYRLTSSGMSLNIYVSDRHIDAAPRAVNSLSGGEGFLASLALALALSTISKERIDIDILFIDEGFGTLSPGPLDKAMNTLRKLSHNGNRRVGIISHVEALRSFVPAKIQLERTSSSSSRLRITEF